MLTKGGGLDRLQAAKIQDIISTWWGSEINVHGQILSQYRKTASKDFYHKALACQFHTGDYKKKMLRCKPVNLTFIILTDRWFWYRTPAVFCFTQKRLIRDACTVLVMCNFSNWQNSIKYLYLCPAIYIFRSLQSMCCPFALTFKSAIYNFRISKLFYRLFIFGASLSRFWKR